MVVIYPALIWKTLTLSHEGDDGTIKGFPRTVVNSDS